MLGVDVNPTALATFEANHGAPLARPATWLGDIRKLSVAALWDILGPRGVEAPCVLDLLVGGPPCEGFSRNKVYTAKEIGNADDLDPRATQKIEYAEEKYWTTAWAGGQGGATRSVRAYNPFLEDDRNYLFREFLRLADELRPKAIVIENVRQMLEHREGEIASEILNWFSKNGYNAEARVLNAADFGVPQQRLRAFIIAIRADVPASAAPWPKAAHGNGRTAGGGPLPTSVRDAINDLPPALPRTKVDIADRPSVSSYRTAPSNAFQHFVRSSIAGPANHIYRTPSEQVMRRIKAMKPGMKAHDLPKDLQTKKYYYNSYGRLEWDKPANTITKSFLYPGSGKFCHPEEDRVISYREAARLQSFDDDFVFHASSQEGLAHMIGSAVPPLLGYQFGMQIADLLDKAAETPALTRRRTA